VSKIHIKDLIKEVGVRKAFILFPKKTCNYSKIPFEKMIKKCIN